MKPTIYIIRGLPGAGKTTFAHCLGATAVAADDFMVDEGGGYVFDPQRLPEVHTACLNLTREMLVNGCDVAVNNTFSRAWEVEPYQRAAADVGAHVVVIDLFDGGCTDAELAARCVHDVPALTIRRMRERWERLP